ncbi:hypothetical protein ACI6Q2_09805 [Chitinophagaceae bacterium LWZ2-11]
MKKKFDFWFAFSASCLFTLATVAATIILICQGYPFDISGLPDIFIYLFYFVLVFLSYASIRQVIALYRANVNAIKYFLIIFTFLTFSFFIVYFGSGKLNIDRRFLILGAFLSFATIKLYRFFVVLPDLHLTEAFEGKSADE